MRIKYSKRFTKQLATQPAKVQEAFFLRIAIFESDPFEPVLHNHQLTGKLKRFRSINVTGDVRALYEVVDDEVYLYEMIGSHSQLYGK